jgi:hypothetical protein
MHRALVLALLAFTAAALAPTAGFAGSCSPTATRLCLHDSRFGVEVAWTIPGGGSGIGHASPQTNDTGLFWFFSDSNLELVVKVLDGRAINGHFWVYYGGLSDVEYTITVTDNQTGESEIYHNPASQLASGADTSAFAEEPLAASGQIRFGMLGDVSATAADASTTAAIAAIPLRQGSELRANVTPEGAQNDPDVAIGADGGSMVVWTGESSEALEVYGRFYDSAGNPRGGESRLNDNLDGIQWQVRVAAVPGGGYMAVWQDGGFVIGRAYGVDGQPLTNEIRISTSRGPQTSPDIAAADGGFVVAWADDSPNPSTGDPGTTIVGQRFNAQGGRVGSSFLIGGTSEDLREPRLAASPTGGFLATWIEHLGLGQDVVAQRIDAMSQPLGDTLRANFVDSSRLPGLHQGALPICHADGSFSILWTMSLPSGQTGPQGLLARHYSAAGAALGGVIELRRGVARQTPAATLLPSGDILVLWEEVGHPADPDGGVLGRLFDSSWTPRSSEIRINAFTLLAQREPAVASDASGRLTAVWTSGTDTSLGPIPGDLSQDGSAFGVFGQRFTTATCALTSNQLCLNGRFRVDVQFTSPWSGNPESAQPVPLTSDTGAFWFFGEDNLELMIKVLDGRAVNSHFWVYAGALSDVTYTISVTDTVTGQVKTYRNAQGQLASRADVEAF